MHKFASQTKPKKMLSRKVNLSYLLLSCILSIAVTFTICFQKFKHKNSTGELQAKSIPMVAAPSCGVVSHRMEGYKFIKPLLYADKICETGNYQGLKYELVDAIDKFKQAGMIDNASVYLKIYNHGGEFLSINENELFHPGSLIKLPILITYLTMEEKTPGILNKKLLFTLPPGGVPQQTYNSNQIVPGKSYSIKELLKYMVAYSDNNATYLLNNNVDLAAFSKMFSDLGLTVPDVHDPNFQITAKDYSAFFKVIYNAGYLNIANSEYVAELLNQCDFKDGIQSGLPADVEIAHKFGEWGDRKNPTIHQLSESGIIYIKNSPYLLTVMTQGKDVKKLPDVLRAISKITFKNIKEKEETL